jgi:hypothetical protein
MKVLQPAVGLHGNRQWRERWQDRTGLTWGTVATGSPLVRPLLVVVVQKLFGHAAHFSERTGMVHEQTLLLVRAVISLHVGIFVWPLRRTDVGGNPQADEKAHQRGGKIPPATTAHPTRITIESEHGWPSIGA